MEGETRDANWLAQEIGALLDSLKIINDVWPGRPDHEEGVEHASVDLRIGDAQYDIRIERYG